MPHAPQLRRPLALWTAAAFVAGGALGAALERLLRSAARERRVEDDESELLPVGLGLE